MHKHLILLLLTLLFFTSFKPVRSSPTEYTVLFADRYTKKEWRYYTSEIDYIKCSVDWRDLPVFVKNAVKRAKGRKIKFILSVHGSPQGILCMSNTKTGKVAKSNMSYVIKTLNEYIPKGQLQDLELEACYAGICVQHRNWTCLPVGIGECYDVNNETLDAPIYGATDSPNFFTSVYLQVKHNLFVSIDQLTENSPPLTPKDCDDTKNPSIYALRLLSKNPRIRLL